MSRGRADPVVAALREAGVQGEPATLPRRIEAGLPPLLRALARARRGPLASWIGPADRRLPRLLRRLLPRPGPPPLEGLGALAPVPALAGLVPEPGDPLLRALAAQPWLAWLDGQAHGNLDLPLRVVERAHARVAAATRRQEQVRGELEAGEALWREAASLEGVEGATRAPQRARAAVDAIRQGQRRSRELERALDAAARAVQQERGPLQRVSRQPPPGRGLRVVLHRDLSPVLEQVEAALRAADEVAALAGLPPLGAPP